MYGIIIIIIVIIIHNNMILVYHDWIRIPTVDCRSRNKQRILLLRHLRIGVSNPVGNICNILTILIIIIPTIPITITIIHCFHISFCKVHPFRNHPCWIYTYGGTTIIIQTIENLPLLHLYQLIGGKKKDCINTIIIIIWMMIHNNHHHTGWNVT